MLNVKWRGCDFLVMDAQAMPQAAEKDSAFQTCVTTLPHPFEVHVTIDPVLDSSAAVALALVAELNSFRIAELFKASGERSDKDSFLTGRFATYQLAQSQMGQLVRDMQYLGFRIRRKKIECIVFDERVL